MKKPDIQITENTDGLEVTITDGTHEIFWSDRFSYECPEDLLWGRMISDIFNSAYKMGYAAAGGEVSE